MDFTARRCGCTWRFQRPSGLHHRLLRGALLRIITVPHDGRSGSKQMVHEGRANLKGFPQTAVVKKGPIELLPTSLRKCLTMSCLTARVSPGAGRVNSCTRVLLESTRKLTWTKFTMRIRSRDSTSSDWLHQHTTHSVTGGTCPP